MTEKKLFAYFIIFLLLLQGCSNEKMMSMPPAAEEPEAKTLPGAVSDFIPPMNRYDTAAECPVTKEKFKISKDTKAVIYKNRAYYFCCPACISAFKSEPEKYAAAGDALKSEKIILDKPGVKNKIRENSYFVYEFDKKPAMGLVILKIQVFDKNGKRITNYVITGKSGMLSMREHDSDETAFKQNKKGDYLLPVDVAMPGVWEVNVKILDGKNELINCFVRFNVG